jgi:uncharacterized membrane protein YiaA
MTMDQSTAKRHMVFGAMIWAVGVVIIVGSYVAASKNTTDGRYIVAWVAMIFGAIRFLYGLVKLTSSKRD